MARTAITIQRDSGYADRLRNYKVLLDGVKIGEIRDGERKTFDVHPGNHQLWLAIDWARSNKLSFRAEKDATAKFSCASPGRGVEYFLQYSTPLFYPKDTLSLSVLTKPEYLTFSHQPPR